MSTRKIKAIVDSEHNYCVTIKISVPLERAACNQEQFKAWIAEGLSQLNLDDYCNNDPDTDIAQDLDGQTILIQVE
jgi:hypothetical protein